MTVTVSTTRELELAEALAAVRSRLTAAAEAAGRNSDEIELLPITKFFPATDVSILHDLGCEAFGESREQEAANKTVEVANLVGGAPIRWHMVGRIQRNKARSIAGWAYAAHSVDSVRIVNALDRAVTRALDEGDRAAALRIYIQVSLDGDVAAWRCGCRRRRVRRRGVRRRPGRPGSGVRWADGDSAVGGRTRMRPSDVCNPSLRGYSGTIRSASNCPRACPATSRWRSNMARRVCVSVPRYWDNVL